jgi:hypothetical protein
MVVVMNTIRREAVHGQGYREFGASHADLARSGEDCFSVRGVGAQGEFVIARKLRRETSLKFFDRLAPCVVELMVRRIIGAASSWR